MTQEEKQLLLKDLCARLSYNVKCHFKYGTAEDDIILKCIDGDVARFDYGWYGKFHVIIKSEYIKPYLRPMSSMTEEEKNEIKALGAEFSPIGSIRFRIEEDENDGFEYGYQWLDILDFLNKHHFDYRGLIEKGLALEAPEGMYKQNNYLAIEILEKKFPELVESEDEQIRKELLVHLQQERRSATLKVNHPMWDRMISWVEKHSSVIS